MKIVAETVSVIPDRSRNEIIVFMAGFRMTLSSEEARLLAGAISGALGQLHPIEAEVRQLAPAAPLPGTRQSSTERHIETVEAVAAREKQLMEAIRAAHKTDPAAR
jgi:hypothetical protein